MRALVLSLATLLLDGAVVGQPPSNAKGGHVVANFTLASPLFASGAPIPDAYTCKGADLSPVIAWSGQPPKTVSFALIMDDPDAPAGTWEIGRAHV